MYEILIPELRDDPAGIGYAEMTDEQRMEAFYAENQSARQLVPLWQLKKFLVETGLLLALQQTAASHESAEVKGAASLTLTYIDDHRFNNLDMDLDSTKTLIGGLVAGGVVTAEAAATIDSMADTVTSRAKILGCTNAADGHFSSARNMIGGDA